MTILTEALKRIYNWQIKETSLRLITEKEKGWLRDTGRIDYTPLLNPGLSKVEFKEITKDLDVQLPSELIELYEWKNGTPVQKQIEDLDWLFYAGLGWKCWYGFALVPLQDVIEQYFKKRKLYHPNDLKSNNTSRGIILNLFDSNDCREGYLIIDKSSPFNNYVFFRWFKGGGNDTLAIYTSLTSMMLTIADCYEQASYRVHDNYSLFDEVKAREIWQKYNAANLVEATLNMAKEIEFESTLSLKSYLEALYILKKFEDSLEFTQDPRLLNPSIKVLRIPPLNNDCNEGLNYLRAMEDLYNSLSCLDAVERMIQSLEDEYWVTRYWAANALGNFRDSKAVEPLVELLQDHNRNVRWIARESIKKLILDFPELEEQIPF